MHQKAVDNETFPEYISGCGTSIGFSPVSSLASTAASTPRFDDEAQVCEKADKSLRRVHATLASRAEWIFFEEGGSQDDVNRFFVPIRQDGQMGAQNNDLLSATWCPKGAFCVNGHQASLFKVETCLDTAPEQPLQHRPLDAFRGSRTHVALNFPWLVDSLASFPKEYFTAETKHFPDNELESDALECRGWRRTGEDSLSQQPICAMAQIRTPKFSVQS